MSDTSSCGDPDLSTPFARPARLARLARRAHVSAAANASPNASSKPLPIEMTQLRFVLTGNSGDWNLVRVPGLTEELRRLGINSKDINHRNDCDAEHQACTPTSGAAPPGCCVP